MKEEPKLEDYPLNDSRWTCSHCQKKLEGNNFPVQISDASVGMSLVAWISGERKISLHGADVIGRNMRDMIVHRVVFEGCFTCFENALAKDPLGAVLFKALWCKLSEGQAMVDGNKRLMPNCGHGRHFAVKIT